VAGGYAEEPSRDEVAIDGKCAAVRHKAKQGTARLETDKRSHLFSLGRVPEPRLDFVDAARRQHPAVGRERQPEGEATGIVDRADFLAGSDFPQMHDFAPTP